MGSNVIYNDEFIKIFIVDNDVFIETFKKGFQMQKLAPLLAQHPEIGLTNASSLRNAVSFAPASPQKIGEVKTRIRLEVDSSRLTAAVTLNLHEEDLAVSSKDKLIHEVNALLSQNGIVFGVNTSVLMGELMPGKPYTIAQGVPAVDGNDAVVKMYELMEVRPEIRQDGRVDFYELRLINRVKPGDWLGERIEATDGIPGTTVTGETILPVKGKTATLNYDKNSVSEISSSGKTMLVSKMNGAVSYTNGKICVSNHLEINGDVGVSTGNIKFDGFLTIKGTINDGFSVEATKDIEINSEFGLGSAKSIISHDGSIYIKGGISSREPVKITGAKDIYTKFTDNAHITSGRTAHIGYYSLNSSIEAKEVVFDATNGQAIGGHIKAEVRVILPIAGSEMERRTIIEVTGFKRQVYVDRLDEVLHLISNKKVEQQKLKMTSGNKNSGQDQTSSGNISDRLYLLKDEIKALEEERKSITGYLKAHGDGEICITKHLFKNCGIILRGIAAEVPPGTIAATFYLKDAEIRIL